MQAAGNPNPRSFDIVLEIDSILDSTVDLISYTVRTLDPILDLEEAAPGDGRACGSVFLNRIFADTLNEKFRGNSNWESDPDILDTAMDHFERVTKGEFNGKRMCRIPMRGIGPWPDIKHHRLELSPDQMEAIFEPVISEVLRLIGVQIQNTAKEVKLILLVGGFGNSSYLQSRIQDRFSNTKVKVSPDRFVPADHQVEGRNDRTNCQRKSNGGSSRSLDERLSGGQGTYGEAPSHKGPKSSESLWNPMRYTI